MAEDKWDSSGGEWWKQSSSALETPVDIADLLKTIKSISTASSPNRTEECVFKHHQYPQLRDYEYQWYYPSLYNGPVLVRRARIFPQLAQADVHVKARERYQDNQRGAFQQRYCPQIPLWFLERFPEIIEDPGLIGRHFDRQREELSALTEVLSEEPELRHRAQGLMEKIRMTRQGDLDKDTLPLLRQQIYAIRAEQRGLLSERMTLWGRDCWQSPSHQGDLCRGPRQGEATPFVDDYLRYQGAVGLQQLVEELSARTGPAPQGAKKATLVTSSGMSAFHLAFTYLKRAHDLALS